MNSHKVNTHVTTTQDVGIAFYLISSFLSSTFHTAWDLMFAQYLLFPTSELHSLFVY